ncbi:MAG: hypothetical protein J0H98_01980 [Solirubrobacterales bacterium]|nr:hypothetical protein [Solirubrobacterales bacterium]
MTTTSAKRSLTALACLLSMLFLAAPAGAFDAGVRAPRLADPRPGAVSRPFEIPISQSAAVPQPSVFDLAIEGFDLDPTPQAGARIGSLDLITDSGNFDGTAILSGGPATDGVSTWTLDWRLSDPILATVTDGLSLDARGERIADPDSALISFLVPGNYHGFRIMGLRLRLNQADRGRPTAAVGAVNPSRAGKYLVRSRIESVAPEREIEVRSAWVRVGRATPDRSFMNLIGSRRLARLAARRQARTPIWKLALRAARRTGKAR